MAERTVRTDAPARTASALAPIGGGTPNIFVDFHAEATAEKKAMGYFLSGKATAVMGTHILNLFEKKSGIVIELHT